MPADRDKALHESRYIPTDRLYIVEADAREEEARVGKARARAPAMEKIQRFVKEGVPKMSPGSWEDALAITRQALEMGRAYDVRPMQQPCV